MTVTLNLPPHLERVFIGEAAARGMTPDELVSEVLLTHTEQFANSSSELPSAELQMEAGVPVLHSMRPMGLSVIGDTIDLIRLERDLHNFGH